MRKPVITGNWKMYKTPAESLAFLNTFLPQVAAHTRDEILLFPTTTSLTPVLEAVKGSPVNAGAQNMHWLNEGAFTGQTSPAMLTAIGCTHILLGHSECRMYGHETDEMINLKLKAALAHGLTPVLCIGESLEKRKANLTEAVLCWQIAHALNNINAADLAPLIIAYEPVWAIGTGLTATPDQAQEAHAVIRREIADIAGNDVAEATRILYGGSVKPDNTATLMGQADIDGALVGGASLAPESFLEIVNYQMPV